MGVKDERRKKRQREKLARRGLLLVLVVLLVVIGRGTWSVFEKNQRATGSRADQLRQLRELQARRDDLAAQVSRLESDRGLEEELRTSFPVAAPGEGVVVVTEDLLDQGEDTVEVVEEKGLINRIRNFFSRD